MINLPEQGYTPANYAKLVELTKLSNVAFCELFSIPKGTFEKHKAGKRTMKWQEWQALLETVKQYLTTEQDIMAYSITRTITDTKIFKDADTAIDNYNFNKDMKCDDVMIKIDHDDRGFTVTQSFTRTIEVKWDKDKLDAIMLRSKEREINNENRVRTVEVIDVIEL